MNNISTRLLIILILSIGLLTACQPAAPEPAVVPTEEEVAVVEPVEEVPAIIAEGVKLDPAITEIEELSLISSYVYEGLVNFENGAAVPALASSWTVSADELDYIFELRPNVTFQDGTPFTADIVIANFSRSFDPQDALHGADSFTAWETAFGGFKGDVDADGVPTCSFDGIEKVDNLTVLIHLNRRDPELLQKLAQPQFGFINPDLLVAEGDLFGTSQGSVIGTGSYTLAEWANEAVTLLPYADYWDTPDVPTLEFPLP